jgi:hypothetical protein
MIPLSVLDKMG